MSPDTRASQSDSHRLVVEFEGFQEFVESCSEKLSETGMFFETEVAQDKGAIVELEARVRDGFRLLQGRGEVVWRRPPGTPGKPPGVAVRFIDLDEPSRLLLRKVVQSYRGEGASLFDPEVAPPAEESAVASSGSLAEAPRERAVSSLITTAVSRPAAPDQLLAGSAAAAPSRPGRWAFAAVALLGLLAGAGVFYYRDPLLSMLRMRSESPRQASVELQAALPPQHADPAGEGEQVAADPEREVEAGALDAAADQAESLPTVAERTAAVESTPVVAERPAQASLTAIDSIFWQEEAGVTVVVLVADGLFRAEGYPSLRIPGSPPRLLVKIPGVRRPFRPSRLAVDSQHVLRVRTGLHAEAEGSTLHVVADLISDRVQLLRIEPDGTELRVVFADS